MQWGCIARHLDIYKLVPAGRLSERYPDTQIDAVKNIAKQVAAAFRAPALATVAA